MSTCCYLPKFWYIFSWWTMFFPICEWKIRNNNFCILLMRVKQLRLLCSRIVCQESHEIMAHFINFISDSMTPSCGNAFICNFLNKSHKANFRTNKSFHYFRMFLSLSLSFSLGVLLCCWNNLILSWLFHLSLMRVIRWTLNTSSISNNYHIVVNIKIIHI